MKSLYFDEYLHCPLCGSEPSNHKVFYNKPYNSQEFQNFLENYYKIKIPAKSLRKIVSESGLEIVKDYSTYTEFSVKEIWSTAKQNIFLFFAPNKILPYKTTRLFAVKRFENFGE